MYIFQDVYLFFAAYLTLAEGQTGVDVFTVNPLQEAAAPVQRWLLLPCLKVTEQLIVHLHVTAVCSRVFLRSFRLEGHEACPPTPPTSLHSRTIGCVADGSGCVPKMADDVLLFLLCPFLKGVFTPPPPTEGSSPTGEVGEESTNVFKAWTSAWRTSILGDKRIVVTMAILTNSKIELDSDRKKEFQVVS